MHFALPHGSGWALLGAVLGFLAGILAGIVLLILFVLIVAAIGKFSTWWRPSRPPCQNGCCRDSDYQSDKTPLLIRKHILGIEEYAWRCKCGHLYSKIGSFTLKTKWVRILSGTEVRPLIKHIPFGRWHRDPSPAIEIPPPAEDEQWDLELCTSRTLKIRQQAFLIFFVLSIGLPLGMLVMFLLFSLLSGRIILSIREYLLLFVLLPVIGAAGISMTACLDSNVVTWLIKANPDRLSIRRLNGKWIDLSWTDIQSAIPQKQPNSRRWIFKTKDSKITISSDGFKNESWNQLSEYIQQRIKLKATNPSNSF